MSDIAPDDPVLYQETVRDMLLELEGRTIVGITQHDKDEFVDGDADVVIELHLDNGALLKFWPSTGELELLRYDGSNRVVGIGGCDDDD